MKHLTNIHNPKSPNAYAYFVPSNDELSGTKQEQWQWYLEWISENTIGKPKATDKHTQQELEQMDMVGIYSKEGK